jgi:16S rRNA pseudouridine516 synthase
MLEYYMFHKPRGCVSARCDERHKTVMDYFPEEKREKLFHVGRLDKDTEGLLIITNDGKLCYELMNPEKEVEKTYFFWAQGKLTEESIKELEAGADVYNGKQKITSPAKIKIENVATLKDIKGLLCESDLKLSKKKGDLAVTSGYITITEGKKHQVKRMLKYAGCRVVYLKRLKIGGLNLDFDLPPGAYRRLTEEELSKLTQ